MEKDEKLITVREAYLIREVLSDMMDRLKQANTPYYHCNYRHGEMLNVCKKLTIFIENNE